MFSQVQMDMGLIPVAAFSHVILNLIHCNPYIIFSMKYFYLGVQCSSEVSLLFHGELNPVASKAQKKVPVPEG